jgi:hypothetical protein
MSTDDEPDGRTLALITPQHKPTFDPVFQSLAQPISDYSFANVFAWTSVLDLQCQELHGHLCVFASGTGQMTLLLPPMALPGAGGGDLRRCLAEAFDRMDACNLAAGMPGGSRIEYVSDEMLERINAVTGGDLCLAAAPMSGDYVYPLANMIDLPGKALKSKRHAKTRFMRDYPDHRTELLRPDHVDECLRLLAIWKRHGDQTHEGQVTEGSNRIATADLRAKDAVACEVALRHFEFLRLRGLVLYVGDRLVGFTLGESLSPMQASILIEKTDPDYHGAPQFIFSEFCRLCWADKPEINVGDDWGIPTLRFTKLSYRPSRNLCKYVITRQRSGVVPARTLEVPAEMWSGQKK